jgi:hypothetical protein
MFGIVLEVVDAAPFSAAAMPAARKLDHDEVGRLEHIARDPERRGETVGLDPIVERPAHQ